MCTCLDFLGVGSMIGGRGIVPGQGWRSLKESGTQHWPWLVRHHVLIMRNNAEHQEATHMHT